MTVTRENADAFGTFSEYRKTALTRISDFTVPPGTPFQTPEGLKAEDEEARIAVDVQGGVYPIRESVFRATYSPALAAPTGQHQPGDPHEYRIERKVCGQFGQVVLSVEPQRVGRHLEWVEDEP